MYIARDPRTEKTRLLETETAAERPSPMTFDNSREELRHGNSDLATHFEHQDRYCDFIEGSTAE